MSDDEEHARNVLQYLRQNPGAHLRKMHRGLDVPLTSLARLMWQLEDDGRVHAERDGFFTRYWLSQKPHQREREVISLLHNDRLRAIAEHLRENPGVNHGDIADALELPPSSLTYYLKKFEDQKLLDVRREGVVRRYRLKNPALVGRALRKVQPEVAGTNGQ